MTEVPFQKKRVQGYTRLKKPCQTIKKLFFPQNSGDKTIVLQIILKKKNQSKFSTIYNNFSSFPEINKFLGFVKN